MLLGPVWIICFNSFTCRECTWSERWFIDKGFSRSAICIPEKKTKKKQQRTPVNIWNANEVIIQLHNLAGFFFFNQGDFRINQKNVIRDIRLWLKEKKLTCTVDVQECVRQQTSRSIPVNLHFWHSRWLQTRCKDNISVVHTLQCKCEW